MKNRLLAAAAMVLVLAFGQQARAEVLAFSLSGDGVSASGTLSIALDPIAGQVNGDPAGSYVITGIDGTFSDASPTNVGGVITNANITGLVALNPYTNDLAASLSQLQPVSENGVLPSGDGIHLTYDNLLYPGGSPDVCGDGYYGGLFDTFGALITLSNGDVLNLWSGGTDPDASDIYGIAVAAPTGVVDDTTDYEAVDYVGSGLTMTAAPEPGSLWLLGTALLGALALTQRSWGTRRAAPAFG